MRVLKDKVSILGCLLFLQCITTNFDTVPSPFMIVRVLSVSLISFSYFSWTSMAFKRESTVARAQGKHPVEPFQLESCREDKV